LDKKLKIFQSLLAMQYLMKCNLYDVFRTVQPWNNLIINEVRKKHKGILQVESKEKENIYGGYVFANQGMYEWVMSEDFASMYPNIMIQCNMSGETFVDTPYELKRFIREGEDCEETLLNLLDSDKATMTELLKKYNIGMAPNGACFRNDKVGLLSELVLRIYEKRKQVKAEMIKVESAGDSTRAEQLRLSQLALKILINSVYGATASSGFLMYNPKISNAITSMGRYSIKYLKKEIEETFPFKVVASDTDSIYLECSKVASKVPSEMMVPMLDKIDKEKIQPLIKKNIEKNCQMLNHLRARGSVDRESISDKMLLLGKKRYILRILDNEGVTYAKPKFKFVGIELKRSDTPAIVKELMEEAIHLIFEGDQKKFRTFVNKTKKNWNDQDLWGIGIPSGISSMEKYNLNSSPLPIHNRAALRYNEYIDKNNLKQYEPIYSGNKIKWFYLIKRNPISDYVIASSNSEFIQLFRKYIDYDKMYETFERPINNFVEILGWKLKISIEDLT
jgi:DNA polymerase elongation subunit (family B)